MVAKSGILIYRQDSLLIQLESGTNLLVKPYYYDHYSIKLILKSYIIIVTYVVVSFTVYSDKLFIGLYFREMIFCLENILREEEIKIFYRDPKNAWY